MLCLQPAVGKMVSRDRVVIRTRRCGRSNPGSNPGPGNSFLKLLYFEFSKVLENCQIRNIL